MGFLDGIAALGLAGRGYENTDRAIRDRDWQQAERDRQKKINDMVLKDALRKDELAQGLRDVMAGVPQRAAARGLDVTTPAENDPYGEGYVHTDKGFEAPGGTNLRATAKAAADYLAGKGEIDAAEKYRKTMKALEDEGFKDVIVGIAAGRTPKEIADEFNAIGEKRIVGGSTDGRVYRFKYEDGTEATYDRGQVRELAQAYGFLKKPDLHNVPEGATVLKDGRPVYTAPKATKTERIDPLSPEGIAAAEDREEARARGRARGTPDKATKPRGAGNWNQFDSQVRTLAREHLTSADPDSGRKSVDHRNVARLTSMASAIAREDPDAYQSPGEAVTAAIEKLDALRVVEDEARTRAETESQGLTFDDEKKRERWIANRADRLLQVRSKQKPGDRSGAAKPAAQAASPQAKASTGYRTTDGKTLPEGTRVRNKKTGTVQEVVNGQLVDVTD